MMNCDMTYQEIQSKRIFYAVLNWGLGHATRSMVIIEALLKQGNEVIIASDGVALDLLKKEFPSLQNLELPAYDIKYSGHNMALNMVLQAPKLLNAIKKEHKLVKNFTVNNPIDLIISDNRYGCYTQGLKSVFIGHQLQILNNLPFSGAIATSINKRWIKKFDEIWVPDYKDHSLSGKLSKLSLDKAVKFIGPLSRLKPIINEVKYEVAIIISGPEPTRTAFQNQIINQLKDLEIKAWLALGKPNEELPEITNTKVTGLATKAEINQAICASKFVICRAGYSSIMDLAKLNKSALMVATPGQTEQEYLADHLKDRKEWLFQAQKEFSIQKALKYFKKRD